MKETREPESRSRKDRKTLWLSACVIGGMGALLSFVLHIVALNVSELPLVLVFSPAILLADVVYKAIDWSFPHIGELAWFPSIMLGGFVQWSLYWYISDVFARRSKTLNNVAILSVCTGHIIAIAIVMKMIMTDI